MSRPTPEEIIEEIILDLEAQGRIRDTGERWNGKIVWVGVPDDEFTGKPWPRFIRDDDEISPGDVDWIRRR